MLNNIGVISNNRALGHRFIRDIDNADGVLKTYQQLKNNKHKKHVNQTPIGFQGLIDESEYTNNEDNNANILSSRNILNEYNKLSEQVESYLQNLKKPKSNSKQNSTAKKNSTAKQKSTINNVLGSTASSTLVNIVSKSSSSKKKEKKEKKKVNKRKTKKKKK